MNRIEYSKNWDSIHEMGITELDNLDLEAMDEEDLDALCYRLKDLGEDKKVLPVYEVMLKSSLENPGVEYTNIFEKVIVHYMAEKNYLRVIELLESYRRFDERERNGYQNHFIRRNLGLCHIFTGNESEGKKIIDKLINEEPGNYFNYIDIAIEYYFQNDKSQCHHYLLMGLNQAKKKGQSEWVEIFEERIQSLSD